MMAAVATVALAACTNTDEVTTENPNFPADGVIRVTTNIDAPVTRVGMTTGNIDRFNIKIDNAANSNYSYYGFYYKQNNVWSSYTDGNIGTPLTMLWQNSTQPVTVTALSQMGTHTTETQFTTDITYDVSLTQSSEPSFLFSDILYMKPTEIDPAKDLVDGKLPITFKHIMSKVNLSVTLGTELNVAPGTTTNPIETLTVNGTISQFKWNASTNKTFDLTGFLVKSIPPFAASYTPGSGTTTNAVANYEVILVPQTVAANNFSVTFTINGKDYTWTSTDAVTLESGKQYTLALTAGKDIVTLGSLSAKAWTEGTGGNIETE